MTKEREALKLALAALKDHVGNYKLNAAGCTQQAAAIAACEEVLTPPEHIEDYQYQYQDRSGIWRYFLDEAHRVSTEADGSWPIRNLYTTPPKRKEWVGLTDEEKSNLWAVSRAALPRYVTYAILVEAKLKELNT